MIRIIKYVPIRAYDEHFFSEDLLNIIDFNIGGNHRTFKIIDIFTDETIGAVEYAAAARGLELRIGLNEYYRYQWLAQEIIKDVVDKVGKYFPNTKYFVCYINPKNVASQKMVEKCDFWPNEENDAQAEGYMEYNLLNPYFQKVITGNDKVNFIKEADPKSMLKINLAGVGYFNVRFRRTYDGMELLTTLQDNEKCSDSLLVETISSILYSLAPAYPSSEYFTFVIKTNKKDRIRSLKKIFRECGYQLDTLESNDEKLVFKFPNPEYRINVEENLTPRLIKEKKDNDEIKK